MFDSQLKDRAIMQDTLLDRPKDTAPESQERSQES
jgi:hypothetical protein